MRMLQRRLPALASIVASAGVLVLISPSVVLADCMMPPPIGEAVEAADVAFVGTVTAAQQMNRWATVAVTEVWRGPDQPEFVLVKGGPAGNMATSVDRSFEVGVTYLFVPHFDAREGLTDDSCTSTTPWREELVALHPAEFRQPIGSSGQTESGFDLLGIVQPVALALAVGLLLLGAGVLARGRQSG